MSDAILAAAEELLLAALERSIQSLKNEELTGKQLADQLDDLLARSLAVLQTLDSDGLRDIRIILPDGVDMAFLE